MQNSISFKKPNDLNAYQLIKSGSTLQLNYYSASIVPVSGGILNISSSINVTGGITGSLFGTATTASYILNAVNAGNGFPFSGSAIITGSLVVSGSSGLTVLGPSVFKATGSGVKVFSLQSSDYIAGSAGTSLEIDAPSGSPSTSTITVKQAGGNVAANLTLSTSTNLILPNSSLAIGKTSPSTTLDVLGTTNLSGSLSVKGTAAITGSLSVSGSTTIRGLGSNDFTILAPDFVGSSTGTEILITAPASNASATLSVRTGGGPGGGNLTISSGTTIIGSFSGSLVGTASTASFVTGSVFNSANLALSASYALTASYILQAVSASFATTASFALNAGTAGISQGKVVAIATGYSNLF